MAWVKGDPWRVVESLQTLNRQVRAAYPNAVPPATPVTSWGSIADSAHSSDSDHYPHEYSALGMVAVVCARDFPHAPALGLDAHALADQLRRSRDPRIGYIISRGRITGPHRAWRWDPYSGSDPHDTHIHVSSVHTAAADDPRPWQIGEDDDMSWDETLTTKGGVSAPAARFVTDTADRTYTMANTTLPALSAEVAGLRTELAEVRAELAALRATPPAAVSREDLEAVLRSVLGSLDGATPGAGS